MSSTRLYPSYYGYVGSTKDALLIIQEILDKQLDLVPRRPHERERPQLIKSGNVFVFIEEHSGIKRWTDGIAWSPSRLLGRFLVYRELDKQTLNEKDDRKKKKRKISTDSSSQDYLETRGKSPSLGSLNSDTAAGTAAGTTTVSYSSNDYKKSLLGERLVSSYAFKDQGLIKKTLSLTTRTKDLHIDKQDEKQTIHLISYYNADDVMNGKLQRPSEGDLKNTIINPNLWNAVKNSSLGGKIPIEDEAYYFLDNNYQLQNMSLLQKPNQNYPKTQSNSLQFDKYANGQAPPSYQQQYMLPIPADGVKREDRGQGATDMTFSNPFTGYNAQQTFTSGAPTSGGSTRTVVPMYNNYMLQQQSSGTPTQPISYNQTGQQLNQSQYAPLFQPNLAPPTTQGVNGTQNHDIYSNSHFQPYLQPYPQAIPGSQYHYDQLNPSNLFHSGAQTTSTTSNNGNNNRKYTTATNNNNNNNNNTNNRTSTSSTVSIGNNINARGSLSQNFAFGNYNGNGYIASATPLPLNNNGGSGSSATYDASTTGTTTGGAISGSSSYASQYPIRRRSFSSSYPSGGLVSTLATVGGNGTEDSSGTGGAGSLYSTNG